MAKVTSLYKCQQCGATSPKWMGQCTQCKAWNSMVEELKSEVRSKKKEVRIGQSRVVKLSEVTNDTKVTQRISTGSGEFDRVLGGGIVRGSVVLIAGEPGVGKSTLLTQLALSVKCEVSSVKSRVLYVCGEESVEQVKLRIDRLKKVTRYKIQETSKNDTIEHLYFLPEMDVDLIIAEAIALKPTLLIIDSIQTLHTDDLTGMAGSVGQIRESTMRLIELSKRQGITTFIVGHVTKEGTIAGPKVLEHMVDVVVQLSGDEDRQWRFAKTQKNRFGTTDEVGVFEMDERGMVDVKNPSGVFLEEIQSGVPGSVIVALIEGTRPILVEIQALVVESQLAMPRRVVNGIPLNKLQVLAAVLQKRCGLSLGSRDIFVNVAGGLRVDEPAADMAIALAIASSFANKPLQKGTVAIGEVGLLGEIRRVGMLKRRIDESKKQGFTNLITSIEYKSIDEIVRKTIKNPVV